MLLRKSRSFFFKLKSCRTFCDNNNYINNSYLNYVQINKNTHDKNKADMKDYRNKIKSDDDNTKNLQHFKNTSEINNKTDHLFNSSSKNNFENSFNKDNGNNYRIKEETSAGNNDKENKNINFGNYENVSISNNENKRNIKSSEELHNMNTESLYNNTYEENEEKKIKINKDDYKRNKENIKEDIINKKHLKRTKNDAEDDMNNFHDMENSKNLNSKHKIKSNVKNKINENENLQDFNDLNNENITKEFISGINDDNIETSINDVNDPLNIKDREEIDDSSYSNESFNENNFESLNDKASSNAFNASNNNSENWIENEEDIPNIFEVDENLSEEEKKEKLKLIKLITEKLAGPLKSNNEENLKNDENSTSEEDSIFGDNRPIAIEVDGPSHFYANSNRYTTYTKLKHRILTKLGYNVIHISYIDWRKLRNKSEREEFILKKLKEKNDEFLDDNDRIYYNERMNMIKEDYMKYMKQKKEKSE